MSAVLAWHPESMISDYRDAAQQPVHLALKAGLLPGPLQGHLQGTTGAMEARKQKHKQGFTYISLRQHKNKEHKH